MESHMADPIARMRRVTIVATELRGYLPGGGMGTATTFLALALARMGHSVEILVARPDADEIDPNWGAEYSRAGIGLRPAHPSGEHVEPPHFARPRNVELALRADPPDVVVVQDMAGPAYSALRLREAGVAFGGTLFVVYCHGTRRWVLDMSRRLVVDDLRDILAINILERASLELADVVISPSAYLVDWMRAQSWCLPEHTLVIPYFTRSGAAGEPPPLRVEADAAVERLAFFGRLEEKKGLTAFVGALNALDRALLDGVEVEFVGKPTPTWTPERVEKILSGETKRALHRLSFSGELEHGAALERLARPGTLAVMPSTGDNSPNTVYECLERGIPFIAGNAGGIPELIEPDDRAEVLCEPTPEGVATALRPLLSGERRLRSPRPAFDGAISYERWAKVIERRPRPRAVAAPAADVVRRGSQKPLGDGNAPYVVLLDEDDVPEAELVQTLARAQAASGADVVTCGVRVADTLYLFYGDPGALGALSNGYGNIALYRRELLGELKTSWPAETDSDWPLLAALAARGARIGSLPIPLATRLRRPGSIESDPSGALLVAQQLERALPTPLRGAARVPAGLAADERRVVTRDSGRLVVAAVVMLTAIAAAIRFATLGGQSYWYDELVTVSVLHRSFSGMLHAVPRSEATPYLYYLLAWAWTQLFGFGEAGLRSLSAIFGTLTVPVTYAAGAILVSRRIGVLAAAIVAFNPFLVWYSQEARAYALMALLTAVTLYFLGCVLRGDRRALVGWSLAAALAVATHYFAIFFVAAEAVYLLLKERRRAAIASALPLAVVLAEVPLLLKQRGNGGNIAGSPLFHRIAGIPKDLVVGYSFPAELAGTVVGALLVLFGLVLAARRPARGVIIAATVAAFMLVVPGVLALGGADYVIARNMIAVVVPAAIVLGAGYATSRLGVLAATVLCALSFAIVIAVATNTQYGRTDWRGAARALRPPRAMRAIVATPTIDAALLRPYIAGLSEPPRRGVRIREIDVFALASQGGFSTGAVRPPSTPPRPAPPGFRLVSARRTATFVHVLYLARRDQPVSAPGLAALGLSPMPATVLLQRPSVLIPR
jgi:glycosyltransferase involved in cell wall biosynthesis